MRFGHAIRVRDGVAIEFVTRRTAEEAREALPQVRASARSIQANRASSQRLRWSGGPEPGERGAAVIASHVDSKSGPAIFYELDQLETGDKVLVERVDGSVVSFAVVGMERHSKDDFPTQRVYGPTSAPTLRLVTCSGDFNEGTGHYEDNTIVFLGRA